MTTIFSVKHDGNLLAIHLPNGKRAGWIKSNPVFEGRGRQAVITVNGVTHKGDVKDTPEAALFDLGVKWLDLHKASTNNLHMKGGRI